MIVVADSYHCYPSFTRQNKGMKVGAESLKVNEGMADSCQNKGILLALPIESSKHLPVNILSRRSLFHNATQRHWVSSLVRRGSRRRSS
jgi:hypothetical protein